MELIDYYSQVVAYKVNIQKVNCSHIYTNNEQVEFVINTQYHFYQHPQNKKKLAITKYVQDLYEENYKTQINNIKELNKWRNSPC